MEFLIRHRTHYTYGIPALETQNLSCLRLREFPGQRVSGQRLTVKPEPEWTWPWEDVFGNQRDSFSLSAAHEQLTLDLVARVERNPGPVPECPLTWEEAVLSGGGAWSKREALMREFTCPSPLLEPLRSQAFECEDCFPAGAPAVECLSRFMKRVHEVFRYDAKATTTFTPLEKVLKKKAGVCQDFAHAAIAELRRRGFAAGYVGGYLETDPPPGWGKLRGADATHAWYAVYLPGCGWFHFDPTNNLIPGERHLITAWGRDYGDVAPLKGVVLGGGNHEVEVQVDVWQFPDQVPEDVMAGLDEETGLPDADWEEEEKN